MSDPVPPPVSSTSAAPDGGGGHSEMIDRIVEELKSQGSFDQFRKDCLAEVDTKPAYQNLRSRVESSLSRMLDRQSWKPSLNKNNLRNQLRRQLQDANYTESGVERIVDQVVNPKISSLIEPEVERIVCNYLGIEKPEDMMDTDAAAGQDQPNGIVDETAAGTAGTASPKATTSEKLSTISSSEEDMEMRSEDDQEGPKGDVSPLTPPPIRNDDDDKVEDIPSPGTPPGPPPLPPSAPDLEQVQPPPPPPPGEEEIILQFQEQEVRAESMSEVSDTELKSASSGSPRTPPLPPLPPPPPAPEEVRLPPPPPPEILVPPPPPPPKKSSPVPAEPLTSPIGSSSDEMTMEEEKVVVSGPSDISSSDSSDLETLEKAKAELEAKLAAAKLDEASAESEGEIKSGDEDYMKKFQGILSEDSKSSKAKVEEEMTSPVSSSVKATESSSGSSSSDENEKKAKDDDDITKKSKKDDSDDAAGGGGEPSSSSSSSQQQGPGMDSLVTA